MGIKNGDLYQIGEIAKESGTTIETIRYYEKLGLLDKPVRSGGGFRKYPRIAVAKLFFIKKIQSLGFTLNEIKEVMRSSRLGFKVCSELVRKLLDKKALEFQNRVKEIQNLKKDLESLLADWIPIEDR